LYVCKALRKFRYAIGPARWATSVFALLEQVTQESYADYKKDCTFHFRRRGEVFAHDSIQHPVSDFHSANLLSLFLGAIDLADGTDADLLCLDRFAGRSFR
jgi:hypothetical protein